MNIKKINVNIIGEEHQGVFGDLLKSECDQIINLGNKRLISFGEYSIKFLNIEDGYEFSAKCQIYRWRKEYDKAKQNKEGKKSGKGRSCWKVEHGRSKKGVRTKP